MTVSMVKTGTPSTDAPSCIAPNCTDKAARMDAWWFGSYCTAHRNTGPALMFTNPNDDHGFAPFKIA